MAEVAVVALRAGEAYGGADVHVELTDGDGAAVVGYSNGAIVAPFTAQAHGLTGTATLHLIPNADISPAGTYYTVTIGDFSMLIEVGSGGGDLEDLLVADPAALAPTLLAAHLADTTDAHDASAVSFVPNGTIASTNVQAAIQEVRDEASALAEPVALAHIADTTDAHAATAVGFTPVGTIAATDAQTAIAEVATDAAALVSAEAALARNADNLTSGTVADARIASTIARDSEVTAAVAAEAAARAADVDAEEAARIAAVTAHEADTTNVHGIADTTVLATDAEVASAISTSEAGQVRDGDTAGGVLAGTYPSPSFAADMATQAELDAEAALARNADNLTSGTVADARIASTIARDSEVTSAISASEAGQVRDGDGAGGVLSGTYPSPGFAVDMATQAELDAEATARIAGDAANAALVSAEATARAADVDAEEAARIAADALLIPLTQKGAANGVATLDGSTTIPDAQIPSTITRDSELAAGLAALVASAPATLDTLDELAAALGDDPNLSTTLTTLIGTKVAKADLDAQSLLGAIVDDTPVAIPIAASRFFGRKATGDLGPMTPAEAKTLLAIDHGADLAGLSDDDHSQYVLVAGTRSGAQVVLQAGNAAHVPLIAKGAAAQSGNLQNWQDSAGTMVAQVTSSGGGYFTGFVTAITGAFSPNVQALAGTGPYIDLPNTSVSVINRTNAGYAPLTVKGMAAQSGDLQQWQTNAGGVLASVSAAGLGSFAGVTLPGSADRLMFGHAAQAQTTVGAAGGASALPATPTKYFKVKDSGGTEYVIPAYAAA